MIAVVDVAICEDEAEAERTLRDCIGAYFEQNNVPFRVKSYSNPVEFLTEYRANYDLIFMDIEMPHMDGITVSQKIRELDSEVPIIIVTNAKKMALKGYTVGAFDFIVKPVNRYAIDLTLKKALKQLARKAEHTLTIPVKYGMRRIDARDVRFVELSSRKPRFHTTDEVIESMGTLKGLEETLYCYGFRRCNNYCLVNLCHITEICKDEVCLGSDRIDISRLRKKTFLQELTNYWGGAV